MMFPVRWFLFVPAAVNALAAAGIGNNFGEAVWTGDVARAAVACRHGYLVRI
jgi:hypothetical protein